MRPVILLREGCWACLRDCEHEVELHGEPVGNWPDGLTTPRAHDARCLVCGAEQTHFYWPGEFVQAIKDRCVAAA